jgi:hypothetical protein
MASHISVLMGVNIQVRDFLLCLAKVIKALNTPKGTLENEVLD